MVLVFLLTLICSHGYTSCSAHHATGVGSKCKATCRVLVIVYEYQPFGLMGLFFSCCISQWFIVVVSFFGRSVIVSDRPETTTEIRKEGGFAGNFFRLLVLSILFNSYRRFLISLNLERWGLTHPDDDIA